MKAFFNINFIIINKYRNSIISFEIKKKNLTINLTVLKQIGYFYNLRQEKSILKNISLKLFINIHISEIAPKSPLLLEELELSVMVAKLYQ